VKRKIIGIMLIMTQIGYLLPAQELGGELSRGRQRLERYLDRAAAERSAAGWEAVAAAGLEAALLEWESATVYLKETDKEGWEGLRSEAAGIYGLEKEKAYVEWAGRRIYAEMAQAEGSGLGAELRLAAREWTYRRGDGSETREINIKEAGLAREAWELIAAEIIDRYMSGWEGRGQAAYSELRGRFSGNGIGADEMEAIYRVVGEEYRDNVKAEYWRIAAAEGNDLMRALLYDGVSLRKRKSVEAASVIARQLAEEAKAATDREITKLFSELEVMISAWEQGGIQIDSQEWLESFRRAFERGLAEWDAAGEAFLTARAAWERDAEDAYLRSEEVWRDAYTQLEQKREAWEKELIAKLNAGLAEWETRDESLAVELEAARKDFAAVLEERKENKRKLIEAQTGIYERSRELMDMARQVTEFWYEEWGGLYEQVENKYTALFASQGPPEGYIAGYIGDTLKALDFNSLTASGGKKIEEVIGRIKLWKSMYLETIRKIYSDEIASYQTELAELNEEIKTLQAQLENLDSNEYYYIKEQEINTRIAAKTKSKEQIEKNIGSLNLGKEQLDQLIKTKAIEKISAKEILEAMKDSRAFFNEKHTEAVAIVLEFDAKKWESAEALIDETKGWLVLALGSLKEAEGAVIAMYSLCGINISGKSMTGYADELRTELIKAKAVKQYWEDEKKIAVALDAYARGYDSSQDSAEKTQADLESAKSKYDEAQAEYNNAIKDLEAAATGIAAADAVFKAAETELNRLNAEVKKAREEYMAVMALSHGVTYDYINYAIMEIAAGMSKSEENQSEKYKKYIEAARVFSAVQNKDLLKQEQDFISEGKSYWEAEAVLNGKIAIIEGAKKGAKKGMAGGILKTFAANKDILGEGLEYEGGLLEELGQEYEKAEGKAKKELGKAIYAVWETMGRYYEQELKEAQRAIKFVQGLETELEEIDGEWIQEMELRSWFSGQLAGIEAEMKVAEASMMMTLGRQKDLLEGLLANEGREAFLAAVKDKREEIDLAEILRYRNQALGIIGTAVAWATYREEGERLGLRDAEGAAKIAGIYGDKPEDAWNKIAQLKGEFKQGNWTGYSGSSIGELAEYIRELRLAGTGLDIGGRAVLEEYIKGMLEYAGVRDANNENLKKTDTEALEAAYEKILSRYEAVSEWLKKANDASGYMSVLAELDKGEIEWLKDGEREQLVLQGARLMLRELPAGVLWAVKDFEAFKNAVQEIPQAAGWVKGYKALSVNLQQDLYKKLMGLLRPGDADDETITALVKWHRLNQGGAGDLSAEWYAYYLAGDELLYVYLSSPEGFQYIPNAAGYLNSGELAGKLQTYYRIENLAKRYIPQLDGDIGGWVEGQTELTEAEKEMLKEYLRYGDYHRGIEYYRQEEESRMSGGNAVIEKRVQEGVLWIYQTLEEITKELYEAEAKALYARYVKAEYDKEALGDDYWVKRLQDWYDNETGAEKAGLTDEQKAELDQALAQAKNQAINYEAYDKRLERLAVKTDWTAGLFGVEAQADLDKTYEAALEAMNVAGAAYQNALREAERLPEQMGQYLTLYNYAQLEEQELESEKNRLLGVLAGKQQAYNEYRDGGFKKGIEGVQSAYGQYNKKAVELNGRYAELNEARLKVREKQEIYDWAESVYLSEKGAKGTGEYETPKEKLGRIEYAYERALISVEVLEELASGKQQGNGAYEKAMGEYREATKQYYQGMVAQYEMEQAIVRQRQAVAKAQFEEQEARGKLMRSPKKEEDDTPPPPPPLLAYDLITIAYEAGKGSVVTLDSPVTTEEYKEIFSDYFTSFTEERRDPWRDYKGTEITLAEKETIEWLLRLNIKLNEDSEYFSDLMLAAMHLNYDQGKGDAKDVWYGGILNDKEDGYTKGPLDPTEKDNYTLGKVANPDFEISPIDFYKTYKKSRETQMEAAYNRIMNTPGGEDDLARYLLYRNSTLLFGREDNEKSMLIARSIQAVINQAESRRVYYSDMEKKARIAAAASSALAPFSLGATAAAAGSSLIAIAVAKTHKDFYDGIKKTVLGIQKGNEQQKNYIYIKNELITDLGKWNILYDKMKAEEEKLNRMVFGRADPAAPSAPLGYNDFIKDLELFYPEKDGLSAFKLGDAYKLYTKKLFKDSKAGAGGSVKSAIEAMNGYLNSKRTDCWDALDGQADKLKKEQNAAQAAYEMYVKAEQEIKAGDRAALKELAEQASDIRLSVEERETAGKAYDDLLAQILPAGGIRGELKQLAQKAWGSGTWNSYVNDMELVGLAAELYNDKMVRYDRGVEGYTQWAGQAVKAAILAAAENQSRLEMEVEVARLELIASDFARQRAAWIAQAGEILARGASEWEKARGKINEGYNRWQREFAEEYTAKTTEWEANYLQFALRKQEWVETQYLQAASVGSAGVLEQAGADVTETIGRALEGTRVEKMSRGTFEAGEYIDTLLEGTALAELMAYGDSLADRGRYGAQAARRGNARETAIEALQKAKKTQEAQNEALTQGAAQLAAFQARKQMEAAIAAYEKRLEGENAGIMGWEERMVLSEGYTVDKNGISRRAVVDATLFDLEWKTQRVHRYEYFRTDGPQVSVSLEGLENLSPEMIMAVIGQGNYELKAWGDRIFGKDGAEAHEIDMKPAVSFEEQYNNLLQMKILERQYMGRFGADGRNEEWDEERAVNKELIKSRAEFYTEKEATRTKEKVRDGKFWDHVGYGPRLRDKDMDISNGRQWNIEYNGDGQMGKILLDFQWNSLETGKGWAEAAKPSYDKKLWKDDGFIEPLTMRSAVDLTMQVGSVVVGAALEAVGDMLGGWGNLARIGVQWLMNTTDDLVFAVLDSTVTSKDDAQIWADFGKKAAINGITAVSSFGVGQLASTAATAATTAAAQAATKAANVATTMVTRITTNTTVANAASWGATAAAQSMIKGTVTGLVTGLVTAAGTYTTTVATNYLGALNWKTGEMNWEAANASWKDISVIAGALGAGATAGMNSYLRSGLTDKQLKYTNGTINTMASAGGWLAEYGVYTTSRLAEGNEWDSFRQGFDDMGGMTLNLLNVGTIASMLGVDIKTANDMRIGLFELHLTSDGSAWSRFGTGGVDVSGAAYDFAAGSVAYYQAWSEYTAYKKATQQTYKDKQINNTPDFNDKEVKAGYVQDEKAVARQGHAGWYVEHDGKFIYFEVIGLENDQVKGNPYLTDEIITDPDNGKKIVRRPMENSEVLSAEPLFFPSTLLGNIFFGTPNAGVVMREFNTSEEMDKFFEKKGLTGVDFTTKPSQNAVIYDVSRNLGNDYIGYYLLFNNCGQIANLALSVPGSGINPGKDLIAPNKIGTSLLENNKNATLRQKK